ncbi:MAG TPA: hypothetical protein VM575_14200, partial [Nocardioides sp.]|nr:hypothetical protein [Nocardioides sp.]
MRARGALVALACAALLPLAACSDDPPPPTYSGGGYDDVVTLMQRTLTQRAAALTAGDLTRFRRTLDRTDAGLLDSEQSYFDNLAQLPVGRLRIRVVEDTITPIEGTDLDGGTEYWAEVVIALRLDGYDAAPVQTRDRYRFVPTADGARLLVGSTTDYGWEEQHPGNAQPWDLGVVHVEEAPGVLGIFDEWTDDDAAEVLDAASTGRSEVRALVGSDDDSVSGVIVYSLQDPTFLDGLAGQTVGDPDRADGLTIAVPVDSLAPGKGVASYRIFVNPRVLYEPETVVGRLVRHELTHAVLGARGRGAPLWLNEGIAEYVSVRPMAPGQR